MEDKKSIGNYGGKCPDCGLILIVGERACKRCGKVFEIPAQAHDTDTKLKPDEKE